MVFLNLAPTTSHPAVAMPYDLFYAITGVQDVYAVEIFDGTWTVNTLKEHMKVGNPQMLASYHANTLTLYKVNIDISKTDIIDEVTKQTHRRSTADGTLMIPALKLSRYFQEPDVPPEMIHILVELPPGESFNPRVWCVTEMFAQPRPKPHFHRTLWSTLHKNQNRSLVKI